MNEQTHCNVHMPWNNIRSKKKWNINKHINESQKHYAKQKLLEFGLMSFHTKPHVLKAWSSAEGITGKYGGET